MEDNFNCEYCSTVNSTSNRVCSACGAPLPLHKNSLSSDNQRINKQQPNQVSRNNSLHQIQEQGEKIDKIYRTGIHAYALFWRTLAEIFSIAVVGFGLGVVGGATEMAVWGVLGAFLLGITVGFVRKMFYLVLFGAPIGLAAGALVDLFLWFMGFSPKVFIFPMIAGAVITAYLGNHNSTRKHLNGYEKVRPFLGAGGGLLFGIFGTLIGSGLQTLVFNFIY